MQPLNSGVNRRLTIRSYGYLAEYSHASVQPLNTGVDRRLPIRSYGYLAESATSERQQR